MSLKSVHPFNDSGIEIQLDAKFCHLVPLCGPALGRVYGTLEYLGVSTCLKFDNSVSSSTI